MKAVCQQYYRARNNHRSPLLVSSLGLGHFWPHVQFPPRCGFSQKGLVQYGDSSPRKRSPPPGPAPAGRGSSCQLFVTFETHLSTAGDGFVDLLSTFCHFCKSTIQGQKMSTFCKFCKSTTGAMSSRHTQAMTQWKISWAYCLMVNF